MVFASKLKSCLSFTSRRCNNAQFWELRHHLLCMCCRSDVPYPSHSYLGSRDPVLQRSDSQPATTNKREAQPATNLTTNLATSQLSSGDYTRAEQYLQEQQNFADSRSFNQFLLSQQKQTLIEENGNILNKAPPSSQLVPNSPNQPAAPDEKPAQNVGSSVIQRTITDSAQTHTEETPAAASEHASSQLDSRTTSTPLSTDSLSDSEVPAKDLATATAAADTSATESSKKPESAAHAQSEQYKQAGYYKEYLKRSVILVILDYKSARLISSSCIYFFCAKYGCMFMQKQCSNQCRLKRRCTCTGLISYLLKKKA